MAAVDPTYLMYPIASLLASAMLLLVLMTSFIRQNWNLGVIFLCFWLFLENLANGVNAIVWSDNADIKLEVYCDIVSHLDMITYVVKPMSTLIITRRLYLIASLQSIELPNRSSKRWNLAVEWTLGLIMPLLIGGPIYYVHQGARFVVFEEFGCTDAPQTSILEILTIEVWVLLPPLISVTCYYPRVLRIFYRQNRDLNSFLRSNLSVSRTNYIRILALASIDILLTLPFGILSIVLVATSSTAEFSPLPFYWGWASLHTDWAPVGYSSAEIKASGTATLAQEYFANWASPILAFTIFGLFGLTSEARASYWRVICTLCKRIGCLSIGKKQPLLYDIESGRRPQGPVISLQEC